MRVRASPTQGSMRGSSTRCTQPLNMGWYAMPTGLPCHVCAGMCGLLVSGSITALSLFPPQLSCPASGALPPAPTRHAGAWTPGGFFRVQGAGVPPPPSSPLALLPSTPRGPTTTLSRAGRAESTAAQTPWWRLQSISPRWEYRGGTQPFQRGVANNERRIHHDGPSKQRHQQRALSLRVQGGEQAPTAAVWRAERDTRSLSLSLGLAHLMRVT